MPALTQEQYENWKETATFENQSVGEEFGADLPLKNYFEDGELQILSLIRYDPTALQKLRNNPASLGINQNTGEPFTKEFIDNKLKTIGDKYNFYNRRPVDPKGDPQPFGNKLFENVQSLLSTPIAQPGLAPPSIPITPPKYNVIDETVGELQERGFSGYKEYDDPNRNVIFKGFDFDSVRNLSFFQPRNKTPRDLNFALETVSKRTGVDQGKAYWADPSKPELGMQIEHPGSKEVSAFNLPRFTPWRDSIDFLQTETPAFIGELIFFKYGRGAAKEIFEKQKYPGGVAKVLEWGGTATGTGFSASLGETFRLSMGKLMGAHDRSYPEIFLESGMTGLLSTLSVGALDGLARGLPLIKDMLKGEVLPDAMFSELDEAIKAARRSDAGIQTRGKVQQDINVLPDGTIRFDDVGTSAQEVTTKEINEAVAKLVPDSQYFLGKDTDLTIAPAALSEAAADFEILFLKNSTDPEIRKIFRNILDGDQVLMQRFLSSLNRELGAGIDKDLSGNSISSYFKEGALERADDLRAASALAMDNVLNAMGGSSVDAGGNALYKNVPNAKLSTDLQERSHSRFREISDAYVAEYNKNFNTALEDPRYIDLTTGGGKTAKAAEAWEQIGNNTDALFRDVESAGAREDFYELLGVNGKETLAKLRNRAPVEKEVIDKRNPFSLNEKGEKIPNKITTVVSGPYARANFTLKELNDARVTLNKHVASTNNELSRKKASDLERALSDQMFQLLKEGASVESKIPLTSDKKLMAWMKTNDYGFDIKKAWTQQKDAILRTKYVAEIANARANPENFVNDLLATNVKGSLTNEKVTNLVYILNATNAPELRILQDSVIAKITNKVNELPGSGVAPTPFQKGLAYTKFLKENESTLRAFFPKDDFKNINTLKSFEKNVLNQLEKEDALINQITTQAGDSNYTNVVKGVLEMGESAKRAGDFENALAFIKPFLDESPLLQKRTASVAKSWVVSKIMKRGDDGIWSLDPEELNKMLYEGFGPAETGKTFSDLFSPLIGSEGKQYVKNLEYLDLMAQRYQIRQGSVDAIDEAALTPGTGFIERMLNPPLTQRGRRITAIRNLAQVNSGKYIGELLLNPKKLDKAIKARKAKLNFQAALRVMTALGVNSYMDPAEEYSDYDPKTKKYLNSTQSRANRNVVNVIEFVTPKSTGETN